MEAHEHDHCGCEYTKHLVGTLMGAMIAIPGIAIGFYSVYWMVTWLGN